MVRSILIADQDVNYREILKILLEKSGYTVTALKDGYQIGDLIKGKTFDIIFLDTQTGGIRDKILFAKIKKECPNTHIILMTPKRGDSFIREAMDCGAYGCIDKPLNPDEVLTMVHHIIPNKRSGKVESEEKKQDNEKKNYQD